MGRGGDPGRQHDAGHRQPRRPAGSRPRQAAPAQARRGTHRQRRQPTRLRATAGGGAAGGATASAALGRAMAVAGDRQDHPSARQQRRHGQAGPRPAAAAARPSPAAWLAPGRACAGAGPPVRRSACPSGTGTAAATSLEGPLAPAEQGRPEPSTAATSRPPRGAARRARSRSRAKTAAGQRKLARRALGGGGVLCGQVEAREINDAVLAPAPARVGCPRLLRPPLRRGLGARCLSFGESPSAGRRRQAASRPRRDHDLAVDGVRR